MGIGSMVFMVPHFYAEPHLVDATSSSNNASENICQRVSVREQDMGLGVLSSGEYFNFTDSYFFTATHASSK